MSSLAHLQCPTVRTDQLTCEEIAEERVIYDGRNKKVHHLNTTLNWIWNKCDGNTSVKAMAAAFDQQFNTDQGTHIISTGLQQLQDRELLENSTALNEGMPMEAPIVSRRSAMIGGSVIMPVIVSMLAPTVAAAKSPEPVRPKPIPQPIPRERIKEKVKDRIEDKIEDLINKLLGKK